MGFASGWLESGALFPRLIREAPEKDTGIIVVVPAFDEPDIIQLLDSLSDCTKPNCGAEIIVVVNAPENADVDSLTNNELTIKNIKSWENGKKTFFRLFVVETPRPALKGWGVGMARKTGMDEALRRFDLSGRPEGIIANTDADCTVRNDYFTALEADFLLVKGRKSCSVFFEHPIEGEKYPPEVYESVRQYELHLRYYCQALRFAGFPNAYQTVGSSLAVRAEDYMKAGGMNRRQAGEDFYFIQKLVAAGGHFNLNSTTVYPSPRVSGRVPFGTGAAVGKMVTDRETVFRTYNFDAFRDLRSFFQISESLGTKQENDLFALYQTFPASLKSFIAPDEWAGKISEIVNNTSSREAFRKRFYNWFNMFRIVKFLNFTHRNFYHKIRVADAAGEFIKLIYKADLKGSETAMIRYLREREREF